MFLILMLDQEDIAAQGLLDQCCYVAFLLLLYNFEDLRFGIYSSQ
jgi:hypothetical protein